MEKIIRNIFVLVFAFIAQIIDGGIGMGYGVSLTTLLLSMGLGTAVASATVHASEIFTTLVSGVSHLKFGNVNKKILVYLAIPGVIGGAMGAYVAVKLNDTSIIKPIISGILLILGLLIIIKYVKRRQEIEYQTPRIRRLVPLGLAASFIDALGGGGWGPIATPTLIATNTHPKKTIGSVNLAEFFVTLAISFTFIIMLPELDWPLVLFCIIGGIIAAPLAAYLVKKLPSKTVAISVGILIIFLSLRTIFKSIGVGFLF
jgi:hypothetical protein